jgi:hypothetical protein
VCANANSQKSHSKNKKNRGYIAAVHFHHCLTFTSLKLSIEPSLTLLQQSWAWAGGFVLFALVAGILSYRARGEGGTMAHVSTTEKPSPPLRVLWKLYGFIIFIIRHESGLAGSGGHPVLVDCAACHLFALVHFRFLRFAFL